MLRIMENLTNWSLFNDFSVKHNDYTIGHFSNYGHVVRNEHY